MGEPFKMPSKLELAKQIAFIMADAAQPCARTEDIALAVTSLR